MIFNNNTLNIIILISIIFLILFSYIKIEKNNGNKDIREDYVGLNIAMWIIFTLFFTLSFYKKGQVNSFNGKIHFEQKIIKEYDKNNGELIKTDTTYVPNEYFLIKK